MKHQKSTRLSLTGKWGGHKGKCKNTRFNQQISQVYKNNSRKIVDAFWFAAAPIWKKVLLQIHYNDNIIGGYTSVTRVSIVNDGTLIILARGKLFILGIWSHFWLLLMVVMVNNTLLPLSKLSPSKELEEDLNLLGESCDVVKMQGYDKDVWSSLHWIPWVIILIIIGYLE